MLSRRVATFLVGAWIGCGILLAIVVLQNARGAEQLMTNPSDPAKVLFIKVGEEDANLLLRYHSAEQNRGYMSTWEVAQIVLGLALAGILTLSSQRRLLPVILSGGMLLLVVFQHFGLTPELAFQGRLSDFLPDESAFSARARIWTLTQVYAGSEAIKLLLGGVLASYLFAANSGTRVRKRRRSSEDAEPAIG
jgi:hypothetical protein